MSSEFKFGKYFLDASEFLQDYTIISEKRKKFYDVQKGSLRNSKQRVKIYKRRFNEQKNLTNVMPRLKLLLQFFEEGYILADNIFFDSKTIAPNYDLYIIEPDFSHGNGQDKYLQLNFFLKQNPEIHIRKQIFENILLIMRNFHELKIAHLNMNMRNIWIEKGNIVYLRPFLVDTEEINEKINDSCLKNKFCSYYKSPEETFISDYIKKTKNDDFLIRCDLWSLGCIFAEFFLPQLKQPLFYTNDAEEKLFKYFEILIFPEKKDIPFLDENYYEEIKQILQKKPKKQNILKNVYLKNDENNRIILSFLILDPKKRLNCSNILNSEFFQKELNFSSMKKVSKKLFSSEKSKTKYILSSAKKSSKKYDLSFSSLDENKKSSEESKNPQNSFNDNGNTSKNSYDNDEHFSENSYNNACNSDIIEEKNDSFLSNDNNFNEKWNSLVEAETSKSFEKSQPSEKSTNLKKRSHIENNLKKKNNNFFYSKSVANEKENNLYEINKNKYTVSTQNYLKETEIYFVLRCLKIFVFKSIRDMQISLELTREKNRKIIKEDSIIYKKYGGKNNIFEHFPLKTRKIKEREFDHMNSQNDFLILNFFTNYEQNNHLMGFIQIPLGELYKTIKEKRQKQNSSELCEWFNIVNCDKNKQIFVAGKAKIEIILFPHSDDMVKLSPEFKKEKLNFFLKERRNTQNETFPIKQPQQKINDIVKEMEILNNELLQKKTKYFYNNSSETFINKNNDFENDYEKAIKKLHNILFME